MYYEPLNLLHLLWEVIRNSLILSLKDGLLSAFFPTEVLEKSQLIFFLRVLDGGKRTEICIHPI